MKYFRKVMQAIAKVEEKFFSLVQAPKLIKPKPKWKMEILVFFSCSFSSDISIQEIKAMVRFLDGLYYPDFG